jgi:SAM-dependent methyltransferase
VDLVGDGHGRRAVDLATGSGTVARGLARRGWAARGVDLCAPALAAAQRQSRSEGLVIGWDEAILEDLPYTDGYADAITSSLGIMFSLEPEAAMDEARRCLRSGGVLALASLSPSGVVADISAVIADHLPPAPRGVADPLEWGDASLVQGMLGDGFSDVATAKHTYTWPVTNAADAVDMLFRVSPVHVKAAEVAGARLEAMCAAVTHRLERSAASTSALTVDIEVSITTARRV